MTIVALIPARAGSKRCPGKNTRKLAGKPLISWTIEAAQASGIFSQVLVSSDDDEALDIARAACCANVYRPEEMATDTAPDFWWVRHALAFAGRPDAFAILRPTSPFRTAATIQRAYEQFRTSTAHSLRAMQPVREHPGKMWQIANGRAYPLLDREWPTAYGTPLLKGDDQPWHSRPTQTLPPVYVQNASLEMAHAFVIPAFENISGTKIIPFLTEGIEGFDVNTEEDFARAEQLAR